MYVAIKKGIKNLGILETPWHYIVSYGVSWCQNFYLGCLYGARTQEAKKKQDGKKAAQPTWYRHLRAEPKENFIADFVAHPLAKRASR